MASVSALRDVIKEMHGMLVKKSEEHPLCSIMNKVLEKHDDGEYKVNDEKLLRQLQRNVVPFSSAFQTKNIQELTEEFPELQLDKLSELLTEEEAARTWSACGMMVMLTTTLAMIPANMLTQIEGLAKTMAGNMAPGTNGQPPQMDLGALAEGMAGMLQPQQRPRSSKKNRGGGGSKQDEMRRKLV